MFASPNVADRCRIVMDVAEQESKKQEPLQSQLLGAIFERQIFPMHSSSRLWNDGQSCRNHLELFGTIAICVASTDRYSRTGRTMLQLVLVGHSGQLAVSLLPAQFDWDLTNRAFR